MRVRVTKSFRYSPDGNATVSVREGTVAEGAAADAAMRLGCGELIPETSDKAAPGTANKALTAAPRNKGK